MKVNLTSPFAKENSVTVREILLVSNILRMSPASTAELCVNLTSLAAFYAKRPGTVGAVGGRGEEGLSLNLTSLSAFCVG